MSDKDAKARGAIILALAEVGLTVSWRDNKVIAMKDNGDERVWSWDAAVEHGMTSAEAIIAAAKRWLQDEYA